MKYSRVWVHSKSDEDKNEEDVDSVVFIQISEHDHLIGALIQPLAKAMAKITKGVDIPKMIM